MRWTSQPSAWAIFNTATRPACRSNSTSETTPACRATCVSTTGRPGTFVSHTADELALFDSVFEEHDAQRQEQCVISQQQAQPLANRRRVEPGHADRRTR